MIRIISSTGRTYLLKHQIDAINSDLDHKQAKQNSDGGA